MMKQVLLQEKYPIFSLEVNKSETDFDSAQEVINYFKSLIDEHPITRLIGEFDHYSHTKGLIDGVVDPQLVDARIIVFCFGSHLPSANILAVRPRSIGIAESETGFVLSFMEAPMALANETMKNWLNSVVKPNLAA